MVPTTATIGDFLNLVKVRHKNPSLAHVYLEGASIDRTEDFGDYYSAESIFVCSSRFSPPSPRGPEELLGNPICPLETKRYSTKLSQKSVKLSQNSIDFLLLLQENSAFSRRLLTLI
jgi:hypothetical protein